MILLSRVRTGPALTPSDDRDRRSPPRSASRCTRCCQRTVGPASSLPG